MNRITYFRLAAFLPVLLPILLTPFAYFTGLLDTVLGDAVMMLFDAALVFGLPYLGVAALTLLLLENAPERAYARVGLAAPLIFAVVVSGMLVFSGRVSSGATFRGVGLISGLCALVGYFYVGLAFSGLILLKGFGAIGERGVHP